MIKKDLIRNHGGNCLGLTVLAAMLFWFCNEMIFDGKVPFFRDLGTYTFPLKFSLAKSFQSGKFPLWDRHMATGFPLMAAFQQGAFYPLNITFLALPFFDAIRLNFFLHYLIAATGAYSLCRWWKHPVYVALITSALFALGGTTVSLSNLLNHFQTAVWLPWLMLCWERAVINQTWKNFVILALLSLSALLAGSPEIYFLCVLLLFLDGLRLNQQDRTVTLTRIVMLLVACNALVAALGMAQFLPTAELLALSRREQAIPFQEAAGWSLNPLSLLGLIFPDKEVEATLPIGIRLLFGHEIPFLISHYLGVLSLIASFTWLYMATPKERIIWLVLISLFLALAFGSYTPIYGYLFDNVPLIQSVRFPEKFFFLIYACLLFIILRGLAALDANGESHSKAPVIFSVSLLALWLAAYVTLRLDPHLFQRLTAPQTGDVAGVTSNAVTDATILFNLERQIAISVAILLLLYCQLKHLLRPPLFQIILVVIAICDVGVINKPFQFLLDPAAVMKPEILSAEPYSEQSRLFYYPPGGNLHPSFVSVLGRPPFVKATAINTQNLLPNTGVMFGYDYFQEIDALTRQPYNDFLNFANLVSPDRRVKILRALNVRYVVSFRELKADGLTLSRRLANEFSWLYEVKNPVPRVYIASTALYETQPAKLLRLLSNPEFDTANQVILDEPISVSGPRNFKGHAQIERYGNTSVSIKASSNGTGILVLADSYYPGWKVFVDGKETKILRANHFFRGVVLAAGEHDVRFEYEPWSFTLGLWISSITLFCVILVTVGLWMKNLVVTRSRYVLART